jgi:hypothetical protein
MTTSRMESFLNDAYSRIADLLAHLTDEQLFDLDDALRDGRPVEHLFTRIASTDILRWLSYPTVAHELWRRLDIAELEGRLS